MARSPEDGNADIHVGWSMIAAGAALIATCYGLARFAYGLFAPEFRAEFAISSTVSGLIGAGSYLGYCLAIVASLVLTERVGARQVAVAAGAVASLGTAMVALAPSTPVLALGVLIAGSSTGIASPPLAAAVSRWVRGGIQDRAQTVVNAGTGVGVLVSGPIALTLLEQWRWAWALFAAIAAAVSVWIFRAVPSSAEDRPGEADAPGRGDPDERRYVPGTTVMILAAFLMGLSSAAVWTFGRDLITTVGGASTLVASSMWTVLGAAGIIGALGGDLVARIGIGWSWTGAMSVMAGATALLAAVPGTVVTIFLAAAVFGSSYILLTALVLLWSTHLYPNRVSFGVGLSFLMIAVGQAVGAPLTGYLTDVAGISTAFNTCAILGIVGALTRSR